MPEIIENGKFKKFCKLLETSSITEKDKKALQFAIEFLDGKHDVNLSSKSFLLQGEPGVGKTYLVEKFLEIFNLPVIFNGCANIKHKSLVSCKNLDQVVRRIKKNGRFIVFLDDLNYIFKYSEYEGTSASDRQFFMKIADLIKSSKDRVVLLATANNAYCLDDSVLDRIDVKINFDIPADKSKLEFLREKYSTIINTMQIKFLVKHSLGYNFRDLPEVVKIAYREGRGTINATNLREAIKDYVPTSMQRYEVISNVKLNFSHIIGKENIKKELSNVITAFNRKSFAKKLGLKRHNLLVFDGPVGTGKTFMVKALAGELNFPIINIKSSHFFNYSSPKVLNSLDSFSKRFHNCIIFVDEAEKMIGRHSMDEDSNFDGYLNEIFDGVSGVTNSIVVIAVNNLARFGAGFSDRFAILKFELPNLTERGEFLAMKLNKLQNHAEVLVNFDEAARETEGMSFRDLEKICNNVFYMVLNRQQTITNHTFSYAARSFKTTYDAASIYG